MAKELEHVSRHHWLNTLLGIVDSVWNLSPEELVYASQQITQMLVTINIPERGTPHIIPAPLALEVDGGFYALQLDAPYDSNEPRPVRQLENRDISLPVDVWVSSLVSLVTTAYTLEPIERLYLVKGFTELLADLGTEKRAPVYVPEDVVRVAQNP